MTKPMTPEARFWKRVEKTETCWFWKGTHLSNGYAVISLGKRDVKMLAHRFSWALAYGPIPEGLHVLHHCDTPGCVRPDHLFIGTHADNMADMARKGRAFATRHPDRLARGDRHGSRTHPESRQRGEVWQAAHHKTTVGELT